MSMLEAFVGKMEYQGVAAQMHLFHVKPKGTEQSAEVHITQAIREQAVPGLEKRAPGQSVPAFTGLKADVVGRWTRFSLNVPEGAILKLYGDRKSEAGFKSMGSAYFKIRAKGPYNKIILALPSHALAARENVFVQGRFDLIDGDQLDRYSIVPKQSFRHFSTPEAMRSVFTVSCIEPEIEALPRMTESEVTGPDGTKRIVRMPRRRRTVRV